MKWNYIWQPLLLIIFLAALLMAFHRFSAANVLWAVGAGSLASSGYIVFGNPRANTARPLHFISAYVIAILCGILMRSVAEYTMAAHSFIFVSQSFYWMGFIAAITVGICLFLMAVFRLEHPPAAGMALILVIDVRDISTLVIVMVGVLVLALLKQLLGRWLRPLF